MVFTQVINLSDVGDYLLMHDYYRDFEVQSLNTRMKLSEWHLTDNNKFKKINRWKLKLIKPKYIKQGIYLIWWWRNLKTNKKII